MRESGVSPVASWVLALSLFVGTGCGDSAGGDASGPKDDGGRVLLDVGADGGGGEQGDGPALLDVNRDDAAGGSTDAAVDLDAVSDASGGAGGADGCRGPEECDDGFFCNGAELCERGTCRPNPELPCTDNLLCTQNLCDEENDQCRTIAEDSACAVGQVCDPKVGCFLRIGCAEDVDCDDALACNGLERCRAGECAPGEPVVCDDAVACSQDSCDDDDGACRVVPDHTRCLEGELCSLQDGCGPRPPCQRNDDCDDGFFCNGGEVCTDGVCLPGAPPEVDDGVECTVDRCDERVGAVVHTPAPARCNDGVFCNGFEVCHPVDGCRPGAPPDLNDGVGCTLDVCNEETDFVDHVPDEATCDDGLFCNGPEVCNVVQGCRPGEPPAVNDGVGCTVDSCSEVSRSVLNTPDAARCDDGLFCNGDEVCDAANGGCVAGPPRAVDDGLDCTDDACIEGRREVVHTPVDVRCDDGQFCNGEEVCVPELGCQEGPPTETDDRLPCTDDACDEATDRVVNTPVDARCDDGQACNGVEACVVGVGCRVSVPVDQDDGVDCTIDFCDAATGEVRHVPDNTICDDGVFCNGPEVCDARRGCLAGVDPLLGADDAVACTQARCDEVQDRVVHDPVNARCDDGLFCNGPETCDARLNCRPGVPPVQNDNVACTVESCDEANDRIVSTPDNARCTDNQVCNGAETCDAARGCLPGVRAADGTVCVNAPRNICLAGACGLSRCGDRYVDAGAMETCDDGNQVDNDMCNNTCRAGGGFLPNYNGRFTVPRTAYQCAFGLVSFDIVQLIFSVAGNTLTVSGMPVQMTQNPRPMDNNFAVQGVIAGGCTETYALAGSFSDNDNWCGVLTVSFNGAQCGLTNCQNRQFNICGVRAP
jgi:cysteine-rich repeat protein